MSIKLPRLSTGWDQEVGLFARYWNAAMNSIESNINDIIEARALADQAVVDAAVAQGDANAAQLTADGALVLAVTSVQQDVGPSWGAASGTISRAGYSSYSAPVVTNPPTQAEVQGIANEVQLQSRVLVGIITDLRANGALTN